jgi:glycosyltransferase involved in cell wall biosynthesis
MANQMHRVEQGLLSTLRVAVVIPCYRVKAHVEAVIAAVGPEVERIYCVDDACPDRSGDWIEQAGFGDRVIVLRNPKNMGVGGAVMAGYRQAISDGMDVMVKIDGDGQMDPALIPGFVAPIAMGEADYTKGNRFWDLTHIRRMPMLRRLGNLGLSFLAKLSSGYWNTFDPTNGYTAIHAKVAAHLPLHSVSNRYFFETDLLFRLNVLRAKVIDVPMDALYGDEQSNLRISRVIPEFAAKHLRNFVKRVAYCYFLRDLSIASLELVVGVALTAFALLFGGYHWLYALATLEPTPVGTIMVATVAAISGVQFLLAFIGYDIASVPARALHPLLAVVKQPRCSA